MTDSFCTCPECGYESPSVVAGPNIGCGICPECHGGRMNRETTEKEA